MKTRLTMRAALALGLPAVTRNIGRARRWSRGLLTRARSRLRTNRSLPSGMDCGLTPPPPPGK